MKRHDEAEEIYQVNYEFMSKYLQNVPSFESLKAAIDQKDLEPFIRVLDATSDLIRRKGDIRDRYLTLKELGPGLSSVKVRSLLKKYSQIFLEAVDGNRLEFEAGEQIKSGRGAFGRLGGSMRSRYEPASVRVK